MRYALVSTRYKYIYTPRGYFQHLLRANQRFNDHMCIRECGELPEREELYDLTADPFEEKNLLISKIADPKTHQILLKFRSAMETHFNLDRFYTKQLLAQEIESLPDKELQNALRSLGYID